MNSQALSKVLLMIGLVPAWAACSGSSVDPSTTDSTRNPVVLDVRCATDAECPTGFECEIEHGTSVCKSHGGSSSTGGGHDDDAGHHQGNDDTGGYYGDAGATDATPPTGGTCNTDADCAVGEECELEHGAGTCKAHGGGKH